MRLIDADALLDYLEEDPPYNWTNSDAEIQSVDDWELFKGMINVQPTITNVEDVVRCKDCKYYRESRVLAPNKFCFRLNHPTEPGKIGYNFADDDFCSHGVRRNEGGQ